MNGGVYMSLVYVKNKNNGGTYVYESSGYWDKNKQQARNKRNCIGKVDPETGEFVPSKRLDSQQAAVRDPAVTASAQVVGPAVVLDEFSKRTGLEKLLKSCFPDPHRQILAMANYLAIEGGALSYCETWAKSHEPALTASLASQRISEILSSIGTDGKQTFLAKWIARGVGETPVC